MLDDILLIGFIAIPYVVAVAIALSIALIAYSQYRLAAKISADSRVAVVLVLIGIGAMLTVLMSPRDINFAKLNDARAPLTFDDFGSSFAISRLLTFFILAAACVEIVRAMVAARSRKSADPARHVWLLMLLYFLGTIVIQAVGSDVRTFDFKTLYIPLVLAALCLQPTHDLTCVLTWARWTLRVMMVGSLALAIFKPDFAMHRPDEGLIPGIDFRLWGLAPHANALGPMALLTLLLELHLPSRWPVLRWLCGLAAAVSLVLAQSKTAWIAGLAIALLVHLPRALQTSRVPEQRAQQFRRTAWILLSGIAAGLIASVCFISFDIPAYLENHIGDVSTLTGRTEIWSLTLAAWKKNILFGYGAEIWGVQRRIQLNMFVAGQAHNQFIQTLGEAGLVGLMLLVAYLSTLTQAAWQTRTASAGLTLSMLVLMLVRCITETPMKSEGILAWPTFIHAILLLLLCHCMRQNHQLKFQPSAA